MSLAAWLLLNAWDQEEVITLEWRELLSVFISNGAERDRIANEIGIHPVTLMRWASGESSPRPHNLRQLLRALPKPQRNQLQALLERDTPDLSESDEDTSSREIPYKFIMDVLGARASIPDIIRSWSIIRLVLLQALKHLDPEHLGMAITVVLCMPCRNGKVRSLREICGVGTPPWAGDLDSKALLLGAESLAGHVTVSCRMEQIGDVWANKTFLPAYQTEHEVSAVASPIMYGCKVAGCLLISCTQSDYFAPEARLSLIRAYTNLIALAFQPDEFYDPSLIALHILPPHEIQQKYLSGFRNRVIQLMQESARKGCPLSSPDAEQIVWQEIEAALLEHPF